MSSFGVQRCGPRRGTSASWSRTRALSLKRRARNALRARPCAAQQRGQHVRRDPWFAGLLMAVALQLAACQCVAAELSDVDDGQQGFLPPLHLDESSLAAPAQGVTPILTEDTDQATLDDLFAQAMSYIREADKSKTSGKAPASEDREDLIRKLRSEQARLQKEEDERRRQKEEQAAAEKKSKAEAAARAKEEEAARRAAQEAQREEEAARRQRDEALRKAMEARMKEEKEHRQRAEKERQEAMIARELEVEKRKVERVLAAAGGASVGVGISFFVEAFRIIGGPTIVAQILRTPGFVVGRTFRLIEWDLETSPQEPNGDMVSVQVRQGQLTRHGIRECIAKTYGLASPKSVKQYAHFFQVGLRVFYERIDTKETIGKLDEGDIIVWTRTSPSVLLMPGRNDKRPKVPKVGEQTVLETSTTSNPIATADQDMVAAVVAVCAMSRGEDASHVLLPSQKRTEFGDDGSPRHLTSAPAVGTTASKRRAVATSSRNPNPAARTARPALAAATSTTRAAQATSVSNGASVAPRLDDAATNQPAHAAASSSFDAESERIDNAAARSLHQRSLAHSANGAAPLDGSSSSSSSSEDEAPRRPVPSADKAGRFDSGCSDLSAQTVMLEKFGAEARHALGVGATMGSGFSSMRDKVQDAAQELVGAASPKPRTPAPLLPSKSPSGADSTLAGAHANGTGAGGSAAAPAERGGAAANGAGSGRGGSAVHSVDHDDLPELAWKRVRRMSDPTASSVVRAAIARLGRISEAQEAAIVAQAAAQDPTMVRLYEWYGQLDVFRFVRYAGAHCAQKQSAPDREPALT